MAFSYRELFLGGTKFCCCIPVRAGVIIMTVLGMLFSFVLSVALWYGVSTKNGETPGIVAALVIGGLVETFLFAASIFGLVGAIVRKLSFIRIYAVITYVHFVLNFGVAIWFLVAISSAATKANEVVCQESDDKCMKIFSFGKIAYIVVAGLVLVCEAYGAVIVTRYVNQLSSEKLDKRQMRRGVEEAFRLEAAKARYSNLASTDEFSLVRPTGIYDDEEYDPYREASVDRPVPPIQVPRRFKTFIDPGRPSPPIEVGYGGGTWTHEEISEEEKARLRRLEEEAGIDIEAPAIDDAEATRRRLDIKTVGGPTGSYAPEIEELPRYHT